MPGERIWGPYEWKGWKIVAGWELERRRLSQSLEGCLEEVPKFTSRA